MPDTNGLENLPEWSLPEPPDHSEDAALESAYHEAYHPLRLADIASDAITLPPPLFKDFLLSRSITMISGEPYTGKTFLSLAMLLSLSTQTPLFNKYAPLSASPSLFIGKDSPAWDYETQIKKLHAGLGSPPILKDSLFFFRKPWLLTDPGFPDFLLKTVKLFGIRVVFLDTLLRFHNLDENSNRDMSLILSKLEHLRNETRVSIVFTHHTSKPSINSRSENYQARGASVIPGTVDQHLHLGRSGAHFQRIQLTAPKLRGADGKPLKFSYNITSDDSSTTFTLNETDSLPDDILTALRAGPLSLETIYSDMATLYPDIPNLKFRIRGTLSLLTSRSQIKKLESGAWTLSSQ